MPTVLNTELTQELVARLANANRMFAAAYPGESADRQPVHTVYGGAHLFKADIAVKLGAAALRMVEEYAPDPGVFARALELPPIHVAAHRPGAPEAAIADPSATLADVVYERVIEKLNREPVEDFRIDFEDGYGNRTDAEEDGHAAAAACPSSSASGRLP